MGEQMIASFLGVCIGGGLLQPSGFGVCQLLVATLLEPEHRLDTQHSPPPRHLIAPPAVRLW